MAASKELLTKSKMYLKDNTCKLETYLSYFYQSKGWA